MASHAGFFQKINMARFADIFYKKLTWPAMLICFRKLIRQALLIFSIKD